MQVVQNMSQPIINASEADKEVSHLPTQHSKMTSSQQNFFPTENPSSTTQNFNNAWLGMNNVKPNQTQVPIMNQTHTFKV